jgi:type VI secretion system secreted protein VgrG
MCCHSDSSNSKKPTGPGSGPGGSDGGACVDGGSPTCPTTCTISSQTISTGIADRTRTRVGVGEEVRLTCSSGSANWSVSGGGRLSSTTGSSVTFTAPDRAGNATVTASAGSFSCSITFTVIEPSSVRMIQHGSVVQHVQRQPSAGFLGDPYIQPTDVSFYNIQVRELDCAPTKSGYYTASTATGHGANASYVTVGDANSNGSPVNGRDHIWSGYIPSITGPPYQPGALEFAIPWEYKVGGGTPKTFATVVHRQTVVANGSVTISKGGTSVTAALNDPTVTW